MPSHAQSEQSKRHRAGLRGGGDSPASIGAISAPLPPRKLNLRLRAVSDTGCFVAVLAHQGRGGSKSRLPPLAADTGCTKPSSCRPAATFKGCRRVPLATSTHTMGRSLPRRALKSKRISTSGGGPFEGFVGTAAMQQYPYVTPRGKFYQWFSYCLV